MSLLLILTLKVNNFSIDIEIKGKSFSSGLKMKQLHFYERNKILKIQKKFRHKSTFSSKWQNAGTTFLHSRNDINSKPFVQRKPLCMKIIYIFNHKNIIKLYPVRNEDSEMIIILWEVTRTDYNTENNFNTSIYLINWVK